MKRRAFSRNLLAGGLSYGLGDLFLNWKKSHILTLSFDDGFKKSFYEIAEIHESNGLQACLNVIASGHFPDFEKVDDWILPELLGDFEDWNLLKSRGHEVMPHTWKHLNLTRVPLDTAKESITKCLDYFEEHLKGYQAEHSVYNFAFNASTRELEDFALQRVRAVRTSSRGILTNTRANPIPESYGLVRLGCWSNGPENIDDWVENEIQTFLGTSGGWLILNLHGLDNEGWGNISSDYLKDLLPRLLKYDHLEVLPTGVVLERTSAE